MDNINPKIFDKVQGDVFGIQMLSDERPCYDPCNTYSSRTSDKRHGFNSKHNWFKHGKEDTTPYIHRQLYRDSGKHNSIVNTKSQMVAGAGFEFSQPDLFCIKDENGFLREVSERFNDTQLEQEIRTAQLWSKNVLLHNYSKDAAVGLTTYGGYYGFRYVERGYDPKTFQRAGLDPYLRRLKVEPYTNLRLGCDRDWINDRIDSVFHYICSDWTIANNYKVYNYEDFLVKDANNKGCVGLLLADDNKPFVSDEILSKHVFRKSEYRDYYGTPDYESREVLNYITIDYLSSVYNLEGIKGGFPLEYIIVKYRKPLDDPKKEAEQKSKEARQIRNSHKGAAGKRTMMMWASPSVNDSGDVSNVPPIQIIEVPHNTNPERFDTVLKERLTSVLGGHGMITSEIASLPSMSSTGFSNRSELLITAIDTLYWNRIRPLQRLIEEDVNDELIRTGFQLNATIKNDIPSFKRVCDELVSFAGVMNDLDDFNIDEEKKTIVANQVYEKIQDGLSKV